MGREFTRQYQDKYLVLTVMQEHAGNPGLHREKPGRLRVARGLRGLAVSFA